MCHSPQREKRVASWENRDTRLPQGRLTFFTYVAVGMVCLLLFGFWKLQVLDSDYYAQLAERNRIRSIPVIAPRGKMLDREGRVLVDNYPSFSVLVLREDQALLEQHLKEVAEGLDIQPDDLQQQIDAAKGLPRFNPIVVKPEATPADIAFIESHRADLPLLELLMVHRRRYPDGELLAHGIGYVGEVNEKQIEASDGRLRPGDIVGKSGLEKTYNDVLMGTDGMRRIIVNSLGKEVGRLEQKEAISGKPIHLTIDYDLQAVSEEALGAEEGAVVAMDPRTGEVLAMVSHPAYDPKDFAVRVSKEEWQSLNEDPAHPLLNRAIQAQLAPGSVFKVVMATAMLESKAVPADFSVNCSGAEDFYGRPFHCWIASKGRGHGHVGLHEAIVESCDIFFYNLGKRLGIDRIAYYASHLGLGKKTGIDLPGEQEGLVPSEEWKERVYKQQWYPGETISVAVGQGATTVTPLQLAYMVAGVAEGGKFYRPHLLLGETKTDEANFPISDDTVDQVTQGMYGVVNEADGTAHGAHLEGIEFCGKTGSAQLISNEGKSRAGHVGKDLADNAWFVGFAPRLNPEIVVSVLVQHGVHGATAAAPVARDIIKGYYDKKSAQEKKQYTVELKHYDVDQAESAKALAAVVGAGDAKKAGDTAKGNEQ